MNALVHHPPVRVPPLPVCALIQLSDALQVLLLALLLSFIFKKMDEEDEKKSSAAVGSKSEEQEEEDQGEHASRHEAVKVALSDGIQLLPCFSLDQ